MIRVKLLCEDRTGTGLVQVVERSVQAARSDAGKMPLGFQRSGLIAGNTQLLKQCAKYPRYRFHGSPRIDHVVYVIDAYRLWDVPQIGLQPPRQNLDMDEYLRELMARARAEMTALARGTISEETWQEIAGGFHAHVLVWERESLMLPVSEDLGLGPPPADPREARHAARWVTERHEKYYRRPYEKAVQGPELLDRIARDRALRDRVLARTPSLAAIVDALVDLP